jgi:2-polyprenyl-3-methyl-5-hydroxy-6-metoxy-1,4-benzoquinol methylase
MKHKTENDYKHYYDANRLDIINEVPKDKNTYLDIGCARGGTLQLLKNTIKNNPKLELWGIECLRDAFEESKLIGDKNRVFLGSGEDNLKNIPNNYFDIILCLDVLEHMPYPDVFLKNLKSKLNNDGLIISSLPNVRYWTNLFNLIFKKDWKYINAGILDYTHLRFFTKKSILRMYNELGFKVIKHKGINPFRWKWFSFLIDVFTLGFFSDTKYVQFFTIIKK